MTREKHPEGKKVAGTGKIVINYSGRVYSSRLLSGEAASGGKMNKAGWLLCLELPGRAFLMYCCLLGQIVMDFCQLLLQRGFVLFHVAKSTNVAWGSYQKTSCLIQSSYLPDPAEHNLLQAVSLNHSVVSLCPALLHDLRASTLCS